MKKPPPFEVVPPIEGPSGWLKDFIERVFCPIEDIGWVVEEIRIHFSSFEDFKQEARGAFEENLEAQAAFRANGRGPESYRGAIFGAEIHADESTLERHYATRYGDRKLMNMVCFSGKGCSDPQCMVEKVHSS